MIEKPDIVRMTPQTAAVIRLTIPREQIRAVMGPAYQELMQAVAAQKVGPTGPWYSHHFRTDPKVWDFEIGVPVRAAVSPTGRVKPGQVPAVRVARSVYHGDYEGLGEAWGAFDAWIKAERLPTGPDFWERYLVGPESGVAPDGIRTELARPLTR